MAVGTSDVLKGLFTSSDRGLHEHVARNDPPRCSQLGLINGDRRDVGHAQIVVIAITINVALAEAFQSLNPMVVVECIVGELAQRDNRRGLMEWPDDQIGWVIRPATGQAGRYEPLGTGAVPATVSVPGQNAEV